MGQQFLLVLFVIVIVILIYAYTDAGQYPMSRNQENYTCCGGSNLAPSITKYKADDYYANWNYSPYYTPIPPNECSTLQYNDPKPCDDCYMWQWW